MWRKIRISLVVGLLALTVAILALRRRPLWKAHMDKATAAERKSLSDGLRIRTWTENREAKNDLIGTLASTYRYWNEILPLTKEQASAIMKLDDLVTQARDNSYLADADYLDSGPASYREYLARSETRRQDVIQHAQRVVALGLLTEPQAALVIQRLLSGRQWDALYFKHVQNLLGMTISQKEKLAQWYKEVNNRPLPGNVFTLDPKEQKKLREMGAALRKKDDSARRGILTPSQLKTWSRLAAERSLPKEPPELPPLSDAEAARIKIPDVSPMFRVLAEKANALGLSADQKKLLKDLEEVMQVGLFWIGLSKAEGATPPADVPQEPADRVSQKRAEFVKHAEQVALLGILTQGQAEQLLAAVKKN